MASLDVLITVARPRPTSTDGCQSTCPKNHAVSAPTVQTQSMYAHSRGVFVHSGSTVTIQPLHLVISIVPTVVVGLAISLGIKLLDLLLVKLFCLSPILCSYNLPLLIACKLAVGCFFCVLCMQFHIYHTLVQSVPKSPPLERKMRRTEDIWQERLT
jgi:hypothetical protein